MLNICFYGFFQDKKKVKKRSIYFKIIKKKIFHHKKSKVVYTFIFEIIFYDPFVIESNLPQKHQNFLESTEVDLKLE